MQRMGTVCMRRERRSLIDDNMQGSLISWKVVGAIGGVWVAIMR
jgi:hypothetical protein